mmetsp:Transcript_32055/g.31355  ORF Transcript_32055/g.31355 Transcript_32055/m.31355 type:complete len:88 (-) Transcript_32055:212-475(-)
MTSLFHDPRLSHIVPNSPATIRDNKGNVWIISGDISFQSLFVRQPMFEFIDAIDNWVGEVLLRSEAAFDDNIKLFFSLGHFWENANT